MPHTRKNNNNNNNATQQQGTMGAPQGGPGGGTTLRRDPSSGRFFRTGIDGKDEGEEQRPVTGQLEEECSAGDRVVGGVRCPSYPSYPGCFGTHCGV
jgi:hypothetical protein